MTALPTRRALLTGAAGALATGALAACGSDGKTASAPSPVATPARPATADEALRRLLDGNARFTADRPLFHGEDTVRRMATAEGQQPYAIVLGCADSRVPPEILFDEGIGDLFVVRVAGNSLSPFVVGSIEYAAEHLHSLLVVVLGHESCGAVTAALELVSHGTTEPGQIATVVGALKPAAKSVGSVKDPVDAAVRANVLLQTAALRASKPVLKPLVDSGSLRVVGAVYRLATGRVELLE